MTIERTNQIMIQGPCAAESRHQVLDSAREILARNIDMHIMRMCLWKPRTKPGFEGVGIQGLPWFTEVALMGITPATEVLIPEHAEMVMNAVLPYTLEQKVIMWIGSRNQNHLVQKQIASVIAGEPRAILIAKNQMWKDPDHWKGIIGHILSGGVDPNQIILCHRGFAPRTNEYRNPPDLDMALNVQHDLLKEFGVVFPMIGDPSHAAGISQENVIKMAKQMLDFERIIDGQRMCFNGLMIEVHPDPENAMTDKGQQLTWNQLDDIHRYANQIRQNQNMLEGIVK